MYKMSMYDPREFSFSDAYKPKEGRLKRAYNKAKGSIGSSLRRRFGKKTLEGNLKSQAEKAHKEGYNKPRWTSRQDGGKRKRRKTQRKPKRTRRTKRRTRKSRR